MPCVGTRESFEDLGLARQLADGFVAIKVDREELPDVDHAYMLYLNVSFNLDLNKPHHASMNAGTVMSNGMIYVP